MPLFFRPVLSSRCLRGASLCLLAALAAGCASGPRAEGEQRLNAAVGRSIAGSFLDTDERILKKDFDAHRLQYVMPDQSGCTIGFLVDRRTRILLSWSYLQSPEKCWVSRSAL